ncbi:MAG: hydrogenase nickel incorporation protein HypA [Acidimicrobiia bacterium]|nr:hydrogenase nickel incorporation protein HypA [Acidimicrobiia bacterium]
MHELALADAVMKAALQAADDAGIDRIQRLVVKVGELQQIEKDLFEFSLTSVLAAQDPRLSGAKFDVEEEAVRFGCNACGREYGRDDASLGDDAEQAEAIHFIPELSHAFARCPSCGSPDFQIMAGRGITLESLEGSGGGDG